MNGPEHYREAERLIGLIRDLPVPDNGSPTAEGDVAMILAGSASIAVQAQVHATLALAAATAAAEANAYDGDEDSSRSRGWAGVA